MNILLIDKEIDRRMQFACMATSLGDHFVNPIADLSMLSGGIEMYDIIMFHEHDDADVFMEDGPQENQFCLVYSGGYFKSTMNEQERFFFSQTSELQNPDVFEKVLTQISLALMD